MTNIQKIILEKHLWTMLDEKDTLKLSTFWKNIKSDSVIIQAMKIWILIFGAKIQSFKYLKENFLKNKTNTFQKLRFLMGNQRFISNSQSVAFGSYYLRGITLRMEFPKYIRVSSSSYSYTLLELLPEVGGYAVRH